MKSLRVRWLGVFIAPAFMVIIGGMIGIYANGQDPGRSPSSSSRGNDVRDGNGVNSVSPDTPLRVLCEEVEPPTIAVLGRLAPGYGLTSLEASGYKAVRAIDGMEDDLVVIDPMAGRLELSEGAPLVVRELQSNPALYDVALLRAGPDDPSLRSCFYRLEDKPAAVEIAGRATAWMVQNGILTQAQIDEGGTTFGLTDDPTYPGHLFISVLLAKPGGGIPGSKDAASLTNYVAVVDQATGAILGAGLAHW